MSLPSLFRRAATRLYFSVTGSPRYSCMKRLEATQFLPEEILKDMQFKRLGSMLRYAYEKNRFYKSRFDEAGVQPSDIECPDDLKKIPVLTKEEVRDHTMEMISAGYQPGDLLQFKTGGSTGKALRIFITEECSELRNACAWRHDKWSGWDVGEPIGAVWGNPELPNSIKSKLKNWLLAPIIYLDTMNVTDKSVEKFAEEWKKTKPTLLFGHAHSIYILAQYVNKLSIQSIAPIGIISSSMMLLPHERKLIENVFNVSVTDRYGCEEVSLIASECEKHEGLHLNIEHLYIEFLKDDGSDAAFNEPGRIVITDLENKAMPFIRYQVEDVGVQTDRKCSCGRGLPLLESVTGRVADFLIKKDGVKVAGISLIENTLTKIPGIDQMQIIQESLENIRINVVPGPLFTDESSKGLIGYFKDLFGKPVNIQIRIVEAIKPEKSGKYRFSICKLSLTN